MDNYIHLAFWGAKYAICGTTVNKFNDTSVNANNASCPDCLDEFNVAERVAKVIHDDPRAPRPEYERTGN